MSIDYVELGVFISVCAVSVALVLRQVQQSKCRTVACGCMKCERDLSFVGEEVVTEDNIPVTAQAIRRESV